MAQWYAQLVFKGDTLLGEGLTDFAQVEGVASSNGGERYTTVIVSGYALYGKLRGYYSLGIAHLLADPIYAPNRCSIGFHPLHTAPAIAVYAGLCVPKKTRLFGIGLIIHIVLDAIDCWWMHHR